MLKNKSIWQECANTVFQAENKDREEHGKKPFSDDSDKKPPKEKETVVSTTDLELSLIHI